MKKYNLILAIAVSSMLMSYTLVAKNNNKEGIDEVNSIQKPSNSNGDDKKTIIINVISASNSNAVGSVTFKESYGKVSMIAKLHGLNPGMHAIHLHENADCTSEDGKSAGGHWNPTKENHGKWGDAEGYHKGDIGNFEADSDGKVTYEFSTDEWCIGCDDKKKNIIGKSVIVHEGEDDFTSQPSGDAGIRVACAPILE